MLPAVRLEEVLLMVTKSWFVEIFAMKLNSYEVLLKVTMKWMCYYWLLTSHLPCKMAYGFIGVHSVHQ